MKRVVVALLALVAWWSPTSAGAQENSFWPDSIRPGLVRSMPLRRNLRALLATDVDRSTLTLGLRIANRALRDCPGDPELSFLRARILYDLDRLDEAAAQLVAIVESDDAGPFAAEAAMVLGVTLTRLERFEAAGEAYDLFLREALWPQRRAIALTNLAETRMVRGDLEGALDAFRVALATDPLYTLAYFGLAVVLDRLGEQGRAREEMMHGLSVGRGGAELSSPDVFYVPAWEIHYDRALAQEALGEPEAAVEQWRAFLDGGGDDGSYADIVRGHIDRLADDDQ